MGKVFLLYILELLGAAIRLVVFIGLWYLVYLLYASSILILFKIGLMIILIPLVIIMTTLFCRTDYLGLIPILITIGLGFLAYLVFTSSIFILFKIVLLIILVPLTILGWVFFCN